MAVNEYQNPTQRLHQVKAACVLDLDATTALTAQIKALTMKIDSLANLGVQPPPNRSQQPAPATYHPNNQNHPNFSWSNNQNFMQQPQQQFQQQGAGSFNPSGFQQQFAPRQQFQHPGFQQQNHGVAGQSSNERSELEELMLMFKSQAVSIKTLENQIGQIANALINSPQGTLPSDTEANPGKKEMKEQSDSGKTVIDADKKEFNEEASKESAEKSSHKADIGVKQLKLEDLETVALTEECSAVLQQKLPPKLKDPGRFTIPCTIGPLSFDKCLCDLGASINLMPLSVFKKLGLPEPKPTNMYLQLADRSITYPRGILEDILVKVDKLIFPADFVILDFKEDKKIPIILGIPFLAIGQTLINVQKGELTMRVQDQSVTFKVFNAMKFPTDEEECFKVEPLEAVEKSEMEQKPRPLFGDGMVYSPPDPPPEEGDPPDI
ncbi:uncharacterized protein LOC135150376 [Daucus carota subsp. sativus]|uniref:uncharacterized protein LOC135150376 n=1 Tax=Daucus carota subsp. sativus TaxID=79200 RepID=UPI003082EB15